MSCAADRPRSFECVFLGGGFVNVLDLLSPSPSSFFPPLVIQALRAEGPELHPGARQDQTVAFLKKKRREKEVNAIFCSRYVKYFLGAVKLVAL